MKKTHYLLLITLLVTCVGCRNKEDQSKQFQQQGIYTNNSESRSHDEVAADTYHTDSDYKYEYRTGNSGSYEYNYDVNGTDYDGNDISGNISVSGKYGEGTIEDANGDERDVEVEWVRYGVLEATDEDGNTYELEVDD